MPYDTPSRRDFLSRSGTAVGGAWLLRLAPLIAATEACARDAAERDLPLVTFTDAEFADFDAFAARIIPTTDTPGAREANCARFADQALDSFMSDLLPIVRGGLASLNERAATEHGAEAFSGLTEAQQDGLIGTVEQEDPGFFFFAKTLVAIGFVANPEYGGNAGGVGWTHLGFEPGFVYQPPFGYYDRNEHGGASAGDAQ